VQLFVERAVAAFGAFELDDEDAPIVAEICRNLDGIPLAIELAAGRVDAFGLRGLAAHLDEPLQLLTGGRRSVLPRHASLRAALDWGHDLLPDAERMVLRRLAIFAGGFTLEAASTVAASAEINAAEVVECIANLVAKSLIAADVGGTIPCYCLPRTTRAYALERLLECGELEQVRGHYAEWVQTPARPIEAERDTPSTDRLAICGRRSAGIGVAQDWTFAPTDASRSAPPVSSPPVSFHL
jgi:predicted ATPase